MITSSQSQPADRRCAVMAAGVLCAMASLTTGCVQTLFPEDTPRTQFEAYDRMRNQVAPEKELDALGRQQPALRARLAPR